MSFVGRFMNGVRGFISAYNEGYLLPRLENGYGAYRTRLARYGVDQAYFDNTAYSTIEAFSTSLKERHRLYRNTRGLINPVARQNQLIVANVFQGQVNTANLHDGALPFLYDNVAFDDALMQVLKWSNLGQQLSLYVHYAALFGDCGLWVVDDRFKQRVRIEVVHPSKIKAIEFDEVDNCRAVVFEYEREEVPDVEAMRPGRNTASLFEGPQKSYTYTLKVTQDKFETFKNGEPFGFYKDFDGTPISEWDNDYRFVPFKLARYMPTETGWGKNSYHNARNKINDLNDLASLIVDQVRNTVVPMLKAKNISQIRDANGQLTDSLSFSTDDRTGIRVVKVTGQDVDIEPLVINLDIAAAHGVLDELISEVERDLPELALQRIREQSGTLTAPGVRTGYSDAIGRIEEARKNLDPALMSAIQMAVSIGGIMGYDGFGGFNRDSFDNGEMDLTLKERPVIPDQLTKETKLTQLSSVADKPPAIQRLMLQEMDYSEGEIEAVTSETEARQAQARADQQAQLAARNNTSGGNQKDDEDDDVLSPLFQTSRARPQLPAVSGQ